MPLLLENIFHYIQSENLDKVTNTLSVERSNSLRHIVYYFYSYEPSQSSEFQWNAFQMVLAISAKFETKQSIEVNLSDLTISNYQIY